MNDAERQLLIGACMRLADNAGEVARIAADTREILRDVARVLDEPGLPPTSAKWNPPRTKLTN